MKIGTSDERFTLCFFTCKMEPVYILEMKGKWKAEAVLQKGFEGVRFPRKLKLKGRGIKNLSKALYVRVSLQIGF